MRSVSTTEITVRPPTNDAEADTFFRLAAATFIRDTPVGVAAADFRRFVDEAPGADPSRVRCAYRADRYLGGYLLEERWLRVGPGRVRTGWIGVVVTHPDHRRQGVATALMRDAIAYATDRRYGLLLLNGLAGFYDPFGYTDVFDATEHALDLAPILALPPSPYRVRRATSGDATALLALYNRHYGSYPGSTARPLVYQEFLLRFAGALSSEAYRSPSGLPFEAAVVALDADDEPRGALVHPWGPLRGFGSEAIADDWPAALALLQHQARLLAALPAPPAEMRWPLPPDSPTFFLLADRLPVRSETHHRPRAGWMARPVNLDAVVRAALPVWQERWWRHGITRAGQWTLAIGDEAWRLTAGSGELQLAERSADDVLTIQLTPQVFTQILFGYRPVVWAAAQPGQSIPQDLVPLLEHLLPLGRAWITPTDGC